MKATLYEALGVAPTAREDELQAALRRLIRRYYAKARDGEGNVEEALRFINYASRILGSPELRQRYDDALAATADDDEAPALDELIAGRGPGSGRSARSSLPASSNLLVAKAGLNTQPGAGARTPTAAASNASAAATDDARLPHTGLAQSVGHIGRSRYVQAVLSLAVLLFAAMIVSLALPSEDFVGLAKNALVSVTALLVVVAAVYGVVHATTGRKRRSRERVPAQTDMAVVNWRREQTVFLGTEKPVEDAGWIFQLRMAELERAQTRRTSEPRPVRRLAARLLDYGLWGALLVILADGIGLARLLPEALAAVLRNPFVAPVLITASWIPAEAAMGAWLGTTPGKRLFSIFVQFAISDAYAERTEGANFRRWLRRGWRVWARGVAFGIPIAAPFAMALAAERLKRDQETSWDYAGDCLVTQGGVAAPGLATGLAGIAAATWFFAIHWSAPVIDTVLALRQQEVRLIDAAVERWHPLVSSAGGSVPRTTGAAEPTRAGPTTRAVNAANAPSVPATPAVASTSRSESTAAARRSAGADVPTVTVVAVSPDAAPTPDAAAVLRRERALAVARSEGRRALRDADWTRAARACESWVLLEPSSLDGWRCYGQSLGGVGRHREAVTALRRAAALAPEDETLKLAIARSEEAMLAQFRNRYGGGR